jgi:hypothetical protein
MFRGRKPSASGLVCFRYFFCCLGVLLTQGAYAIICPPRGRIVFKVSDWRGTYLAFFVSILAGGAAVGRLNLHIDESGNQDLSEGLYLVTVVMHDHGEDIETPIERYVERLAVAGLPDIPFHGKDLLHGNEDYAALNPSDRKRLLAQFSRFVRELPVSYITFRFDGVDIHDRFELEAKIRRDLAAAVYDHLAYFQMFDTISVYYDNGQGAVSVALHDALDYVLARNVADYRDADYGARRLLQVADYICTVERAALAYDASSQTKTQERFFGNRREFAQTFMKQLKRKRFA